MSCGRVSSSVFPLSSLSLLCISLTLLESAGLKQSVEVWCGVVLGNGKSLVESILRILRREPLFVGIGVTGRSGSIFVLPLPPDQPGFAPAALCVSCSRRSGKHPYIRGCQTLDVGLFVITCPARLLVRRLGHWSGFRFPREG